MSTMRFCPNCGARVESGAKFCRACGDSLSQPQAVDPDAASVRPPSLVLDEASQQTVQTPKKKRGSPVALVLVFVGLGLVGVAVFLTIPPSLTTIQNGSAVPSMPAADGSQSVFVEPSDVDQIGGAPTISQANSDRPNVTSVGDDIRVDRVTSKSGSSVHAISSSWKTYVNERYGVIINYPAHVFSQAEEAPFNNAGRNFTGPTGVALSVYSTANALLQDPIALLEQETRELPIDGILMQLTWDNGFDVLYTKGANESYTALLTSDDGNFLHWLSITWPATQSADMRPIAESIAASFRVRGADTISDESSVQGGVDSFFYHRIASRDYGFDVPNIEMDASFFVEIPEFFVPEDSAGLAHQLVFKSPDDDDPDVQIFLFFSGEPLSGQSPKVSATEQANIVLDMGGGDIVDQSAFEFQGNQAYRTRQEVISPFDLETFLVHEIAIVQQDDLLFTIELTAPKPIWHAAGPIMEWALKTLAFAP